MKSRLMITTACGLLFAASVPTLASNSPMPPTNAEQVKNQDESFVYHAHENPVVDNKAPEAGRKTPMRLLPRDNHTHLHRNKKHQHQPEALQQKASASSTSCNVGEFETSNSTRLIESIKSQGADCVNELFSVSASSQYHAFKSDNMYAVANHTASLARSYQGQGNADLEALYLYLRAGYYSEYYNDYITFVSWVHPAVKSAIDAFVNNGSFYNSNDGHGKVLKEVLIAMDSTQNQHEYLGVVKGWLSRWSQSHADNWYMQNAVSRIFTLLYRGQWNDKYVQAVSNDTALINSLHQFIKQTWMLETNSEFMVSDAAGELGRMAMYNGAAMMPTLHAALKDTFNHYNMVGHGDAVWLSLANSASYYVDCTAFGICNFRERVADIILTQSYTCGDTLRIRSQQMTPLQHRSACEAMAAEEVIYHRKLDTRFTPIPGDNNTLLQVNVFNTDYDYQKYAKAIFGIPTNNGGMYLEGEPSEVGNIPNFAAYEKDQANGDHYVWNLEHEYVHYLHGRYDMDGGFRSPTELVVWLTEGMAEYIANLDSNKAAYDTIHDGSTYDLRTIFATTYDGFVVDRIYRWGYLAVRFMFERHYDEVLALRQETRAGNWAAYKTRVDRWANNYNSEFTSWLQTVTPGVEPNNIPPVAATSGPYVAQVGTPLRLSSNGSNDEDGSIVSYFWDFGDGYTSSEPNPAHTYATRNIYTVTLTVTDDKGAEGSVTTSVTAAEDDVGPITNIPNMCGIGGPTGSTSLVNGEALCLGETNTNWFSIAEVGNHQSIAISTAHGTGDLNLEFSNAGWPTDSNKHASSYNVGNGECIYLTHLSQYWGYLKITGASSNATIVMDFDTQGCR